MPLRALFNNSNFYANNLTEENRKQIFQCPNCPSELIPIIPQKNIIKHFRHKNGKSHGEPESLEHEYGKNKLKEIAESLGFKATTEYRIGKHITDVYIESKPIPIAIEFQCSKCNSEEIGDRTITYAKNGIATLWVLGPTFNEYSFTDRQTKIEDMIEKSQPIIRFNGKKFWIKKNKNKPSWKRWNEYLIDYHIMQMTKGFCPNNFESMIKIHGIAINFDEDFDNRLIRAASVLAKETLYWKNHQDQILYIKEHAAFLTIYLTWGHQSGLETWLLQFSEKINNIVNDYWELIVND